MKRKKGFAPLETIGTQKKDLVSLTGFTLVEVLISLFILGVGVVALFNLFPLGFQSLSYAHKLNAVHFLAERKLEELKLEPEIEYGISSGQEKDLNWSISTSPLKISEGIEVIYAQLDIDYDFLGRAQKQKFVTYFYSD